MLEFRKNITEQEIGKNLESVRKTFEKVEETLFDYERKYMKFDQENENIKKKVEGIRLEANEYLNIVRNLKRTPMKRSKSVKVASFSVNVLPNRLNKSLVSRPKRRSYSPTVMSRVRNMNGKLKGDSDSVLKSITDIDRAINSLKRGKVKKSNTQTRTISDKKKNKVDIINISRNLNSNPTKSPADGDDESVDVTFTFSMDTKSLDVQSRSIKDVMTQKPNNPQIQKSSYTKKDIANRFGFNPYARTVNYKSWSRKSKIPVKVQKI